MIVLPPTAMMSLLLCALAVPAATKAAPATTRLKIFRIPFVFVLWEKRAGARARHPIPARFDRGEIIPRTRGDHLERDLLFQRRHLFIGQRADIAEARCL